MDQKKSSEAVVVAVRVRPLNASEQGTRLAVGMNRQHCWTLESKPPTNTSKTFPSPTRPTGLLASNTKDVGEKFHFDHCLWSVPTDDTTCTQAGVYSEIGAPLLDHVFRGYNVCLFAYGQTGSGKTYTMTGDTSDGHPERGLIPRLCEDLFDRMGDSTTMGTTFAVRATYVEVYNEQVCDILSDKRADLKIRENPETGPFVPGLVVAAVTSVEEVMKVVRDGNRRRHVAATKMNSASSRSHAILTLFFEEEAHAEEMEGVAVASRVNLVDLAGSEKINKSGVVGENLKEAININLSLTTLRKVIDSLASSRKGGIAPPYRDSKLTYLLKDSLGNNAKTVMLATLSPSAASLEETKSTLHYASLARSIKNHATKNEDTNIRLVQDLQSEVASLRARILQKDFFDARGLTPARVEAMEDELRLKQAQEQELKSKMDQLKIERQLKENKEEELRATYEEKAVLSKERVRLEERLKEGAERVLSLQGVLVHLTRCFDTSQRKLLDHQQRVCELERHVAEEKLARRDSDEQVCELSAAVRHLDETLETEQEARKVTAATCEQLNTDLHHTKAQIQIKTLELANIRSNMNDMQDSLDTARDCLDTQRGESDDLASALSAAHAHQEDLDLQITQYEAATSDLKHTIHELNNTIEERTLDWQASEHKNLCLSKHNTTLDARITDLEQQLQQTSEELHTINTTSVGARQENEHLAHELLQQHNEVARLQGEIHKTTEDLADTKKALSTLQISTVDDVTEMLLLVDAKATEEAAHMQTKSTLQAVLLNEAEMEIQLTTGLTNLANTEALLAKETRDHNNTKTMLQTRLEKALLAERQKHTANSTLCTDTTITSTFEFALYSKQQTSEASLCFLKTLYEHHKEQITLKQSILASSREEGVRQKRMRTVVEAYESCVVKKEEGIERLCRELSQERVGMRALKGKYERVSREVREYEVQQAAQTAATRKVTKGTAVCHSLRRALCKVILFVCKDPSDGLGFKVPRFLVLSYILYKLLTPLLLRYWLYSFKMCCVEKEMWSSYANFSS